MLSIFSEISALERIFMFDEHPNWKKVIANQTQVYSNLTDDQLAAEMDKEDSPLFMFYHSNMGAKSPKALGADFQFAQDPKTILNDPYGMFILDVNKERALEISDNCGMEVFSSQELRDLQDFNIEGDFERDEIVRSTDRRLSGWDYLLNEFESQRSNSTIIVDRNLFSNEQRGNNLGIVNLKNYFNKILPIAITESYDILIVTQFTGKLTTEAIRNRIVRELTTEISGLRGYGINIELLIVHGSSSIFENTHQRRILKNYHYGNSEHGFALFTANDKSRVYCDNDFVLQNNYHSIINEHSSDTSIKRRRKLFKRLNEIKVVAEAKLNEHGQNDRYFRLYYNGTEAVELQNRLLS